MRIKLPASRPATTAASDQSENRGAHLRHKIGLSVWSAASLAEAGSVNREIGSARPFLCLRSVSVDRRLASVIPTTTSYYPWRQSRSFRTIERRTGKGIS